MTLKQRQLAFCYKHDLATETFIEAVLALGETKKIIYPAQVYNTLRCVAVGGVTFSKLKSKGVLELIGKRSGYTQTNFYLEGIKSIVAYLDPDIASFAYLYEYHNYVSKTFAQFLGYLYERREDLISTRGSQMLINYEMDTGRRSPVQSISQLIQGKFGHLSEYGFFSLPQDFIAYVESFLSIRDQAFLEFLNYQ